MSDFTNPGYSVVETNHIAAVRTGEIKAQYPFVGMDFIENGMLFNVDEQLGIVRPVEDAKEFCYLHASEERVYENWYGRNMWRLNTATQIPRMMKLAEGDIFETDAVKWTAFTDEADARDNATHGIPDSSGYIELVDAAHTNLLTQYSIVLEVVDWITLPNENPGVKFAVLIAEELLFLLAGAAINEFEFLASPNEALGEDVTGIIDHDENTITVTVPFETVVTALIATFDLSEGAEAEVGTTEQVSGTTENDFTEPVVYIITAENGFQREYTVTVIIEPNGE